MKQIYQKLTNLLNKHMIIPIIVIILIPFLSGMFMGIEDILAKFMSIILIIFSFVVTFAFISSFRKNQIRISQERSKHGK